MRKKSVMLIFFLLLVILIFPSQIALGSTQPKEYQSFTPGLNPAVPALTVQRNQEESIQTQGIEQSGGWFDENWEFRLPVTITNPGPELKFYPVQILLGSEFDFSHAKPDGSDLRVLDSQSESEMTHWLARWLEDSGRVWVRFRSLPPGDTVIYLYYGNPDAASRSDGRATFELYDGFEDYALGGPPGSYSYNHGEWDRYALNPILAEGAPGSWDEHGVGFASFVQDTSEYKMYYAGLSNSGVYQIGLATSPDGVTWTKYAGNPVLTPGPANWDLALIRNPMVWKAGTNDYRMIYTGVDSGGVTQVGYATSNDGINWVKYANNPVFNDPNWATNETENWGVIKVGNEFLMWYSSTTTPREAGIAVSTNLINWTPSSGSPIFASSGNPNDDRYSQFQPFTFRNGNDYYVLVPSTNSSGNLTKFYLYRSPNPYFSSVDRVLLRVAHTSGSSGAWDDNKNAAPFVLTADISRVLGSQLATYFSGEGGTGFWKEGVTLETNIDIALAEELLPVSLSWTVTGNITITNNPVREGQHSVNQNDPNNSISTNYYAFIPQKDQQVVEIWMRRTSTSFGDVDFRLSQGSTLIALGGMHRSGYFYYWDGFSRATQTPWVIDTWYLFSLEYDTVQNTYDFIVRDENYNLLVSVADISMVPNPDYINKVTLYTHPWYIGSAYTDDFRIRPKVVADVSFELGLEERYAADLGILKFDTPDPVGLNQVLTYTIMVENTGPASAFGVVITDSLPAQMNLLSATPSLGSCDQASPLTCTMPYLNIGDTETITLVVQPTSVGNFINTAFINSLIPDFEPQNNIIDIDTTVLPVANLSVTKSDAPDPVVVDDVLFYTINVNNVGPGPANQVVLTDSLPANVNLLSVNPSQGSCSGTSVIICNLQTILSGQNAQVTIQVIPQIDGVITNNVTVRSNNVDPNYNNNTDVESTTVLPIADLSVTKTDLADPVFIESAINYSINVVNIGPSQAQNVVLNDDLPNGVVFVSAVPSQGSCTPGDPIICNLGNLGLDASAQIAIQVTPMQAGNLSNTVSVTSNAFDPNTGDNTDTESTTVLLAADLELDIQDDPDPVYIEEDLIYTLTVWNHGPSLADNVTLLDSLPAGFTPVSALPSQGSCPTLIPQIQCDLQDIPEDGSVTVIIHAIPGVEGSKTNSASVDSTIQDPFPGDNDASESTLVLPAVDLAVSKVDSDDPILIFEPLTYTITVYNPGPSLAEDVVLSDDLPPEVSLVSASPGCVLGDPVICNLGDIPVSGSVVATIHVTPITEGNILNSATATSSTHEKNPADNTESEYTLVSDAIVDLYLQMSSTPEPAIAGELLTYTIALGNYGPSDAQSVVLTETLPAEFDLVSITPSQGSCEGLVCQLGLVQESEGAQVTLVVWIDPGVMGVVTNTVSASSVEPDDYPGDNVLSQPTNIERLSDLSISKVGTPDPVIAGELITYTLGIFNGGPSNVIDVLVTDTIPESLEFVSSTPGGPQCILSEDELTCQMGDLAAGTSAQVTLITRVNSWVISPVTNQALVSSQVNDPDNANNMATDTSGVNTEADLAIDIDDGVGVARPGGLLTYTLSVINYGASDALNVEVVKSVDNTTYESYPTSCQEIDSSLKCTLARVTAQDTEILLVVVRVDQNATSGLTSQINITSETQDPDFTNNIALETTALDREPPQISWILPVDNDAQPYVAHGESVWLEVDASDNVGLARVDIVLWDHFANQWVLICVPPGEPYGCGFDSDVLVPGELYQLYARVYDLAGYLERERIFMMRENNTYLPITIK